MSSLELKLQAERTKDAEAPWFSALEGASLFQPDDFSVGQLVALNSIL
jgi:hypothetical protein